MEHVANGFVVMLVDSRHRSSFVMSGSRWKYPEEFIKDFMKINNSEMKIINLLVVLNFCQTSSILNESAQFTFLCSPDSSYNVACVHYVQ